MLVVALHVCVNIALRCKLRSHLLARAAAFVSHVLKLILAVFTTLSSFDETVGDSENSDNFPMVGVTARVRVSV